MDNRDKEIAALKEANKLLESGLHSVSTAYMVMRFNQLEAEVRKLKLELNQAHERLDDAGKEFLKTRIKIDALEKKNAN